jgi:hypothetical protein
MRWPSAMPAGTSMRTVRSSIRCPPPPQTPQGCSGTRPSPPHTSHSPVRTSWPKRVRATVCSWPVPWQREHVTIGVPGSAPLPLQCSHRTSAS